MLKNWWMEQKFPYICIGIQQELRPYRKWAWLILTIGIALPFVMFSSYMISHMNNNYLWNLTMPLTMSLVGFSWGLICFDLWYSKINSKKLKKVESLQKFSTKLFFSIADVFGISFLFVIICSGLLALYILMLAIYML